MKLSGLTTTFFALQAVCTLYIFDSNHTSTVRVGPGAEAYVLHRNVSNLGCPTVAQVFNITS
uniref:Secreted protein n=1 Tax=Haemonchus contortus TaxID=6289 RepID=A0A7I4YMW1_HAECO